MRLDLNSWEEIFITLSRNKSRSILTAFGVFWGIFMLIVLLGLGNGLKHLMVKNFEGSNQNTSVLRPRRTSLPFRGFQKGREWHFENKDIQRLQEIKGVEIVCPLISRWGVEATHAEFKSNTNIIGTEPSYSLIQAQDLKYGRFINDLDLIESRKVCTIGEQVYKDLFPKELNPVGKFINLQGVYFQIIGVNNSRDSGISFAGSVKQQIFIPISTAQTIYNKGDKLDFIFLSGDKSTPMSTLQKDIDKIIKDSHIIHPDDPQALFFLNTEAMFSMVNGLLIGVSFLIWLVGFGTLLAGIIGVSNIMMITIRERTTEFGIRRAIGALPRDILGQILLESIVITTFSGTAGLALAVFSLSGIETVINQVKNLEVSFQVSFAMAITIFIILIILGILAGLAPAYRALAIKPIDAIREE